MRIAFVYDGDSNNPDVFSGIPYNLYRYLKKHFEDVVLISPVLPRPNLLIKYMSKGLSRLCSFFTRRTCFNYYLEYSARKMATAVDRKLLECRADLIVSPGVDPFVYSKSSVPLIIITGGTVKLLREDYGNKNRWSQKYNKWLEARSVKVTEKAHKLICSSRYCQESLITDYKINPSKIFIIPYGTNIEAPELIERNISPEKRVNFLFIGKNWERKGGEDTIQICDNLKKIGIDLCLTVIGTKVPHIHERDYILNYTYLDKNNINEFEQLKQFFKESHFFIMPTMAEFFGIVFSEAASFSLPVISRKTGPVPEIVIDNITGLLIDYEPDIEYESNRLYKIICDNSYYKELSANSYRRYRELLNWDSYMIKLKGIISTEDKLSDI